MIKILKSYVQQISKTTKLTISLLAIALLAVVVLLVFAYHKVSDTSLSFFSGGQTETTSTIIEQIKDIGEWEFLTLNDEEIIDTVRRSFFSESQLVRIYYGTLRLGIDFKKSDEELISVSNGSYVVKLPEIELLDSLFIDEARTKSFFESGRWTDADRKMLYEKAHQTMLKRCLTKENKQLARENAIEQLTLFIKQVSGDEDCKITFE